MLGEIQTVEKRLKRALASLQRPLLRFFASAQNDMVALDRDLHRLARFMPSLLAKMRLILYGAAREAWELGRRHAEERRSRHRFQVSDIPEAWWEWYTATTDAALVRYTTETRREIERLVWQATTEGWSNDRLTDAIRDVVQDLLTWKAERIARTEIMRLWNMGHTFELAQFEEVVGFEYSVVLDPRTSPICRPLAGLKVRRSDLHVIPPLHPHCRTILLPIFAGEAPPEWGDGRSVSPAKGFGILPPSILQQAL